jgi:hypothetical protein
LTGIFGLVINSFTKFDDIRWVKLFFPGFVAEFSRTSELRNFIGPRLWIWVARMEHTVSYGRV